MWSLCIWQCRGGRHGVEESVQGGQRNRDDCAAQRHAIAFAEPGGARGHWAVHTDVCSGVSWGPLIFGTDTQNTFAHNRHAIPSTAWERSSGSRQKGGAVSRRVLTAGTQNVWICVCKAETAKPKQPSKKSEQVVRGGTVVRWS